MVIGKNVIPPVISNHQVRLKAKQITCKVEVFLRCRTAFLVSLQGETGGIGFLGPLALNSALPVYSELATAEIDFYDTVPLNRDVFGPIKSGLTFRRLD